MVRDRFSRRCGYMGISGGFGDLTWGMGCGC